MNMFNTFIASLENTVNDTRGKIFILYNAEDQPIVFIAFNIVHNKAIWCDLVTVAPNVLSLNNKTIEIKPDYFIHEVIADGNYNCVRRVMENCSVRKIGSKIPIVSNFDTSGWNQFFEEKFDNSWENVCKYVYYNKNSFKYNLKNRTFTQNGERCVPTKSGKLYILEKSETIDMDESCTIQDIPITWIVMNWLKNGTTTENKLIRIEPPSRILFDRVKQNHERHSNGGIEIFVLENDCLNPYKVHKSCLKRNGRNIDQPQIETILSNPDVWSGSRWNGMKRVPLLTNKNTE